MAINKEMCPVSGSGPEGRVAVSLGRGRPFLPTQETSRRTCHPDCSQASRCDLTLVAESPSSGAF